ncbi:hypothetical protein DWX59_00920 [Enterocloster aldenensis]|nr:hypothetical protein DWX59_00920 [Enterocloster aldenensis]
MHLKYVDKRMVRRMANTRDAVDTIKGYYYQFNYSILCILDRNDDSEITIEGIEDVDVASGDEKVAIQCKYYSKTEYNHSVIAKPVRLMFEDYMERTTKNSYISYKLYGTYESGQSKLVLPLTVDFVKQKFFTYSEKKKRHVLHDELHATDKQIEDFISRLEIDVQAQKYETLEKSVIDGISILFSCSKVESELYYYNNALRVIKELATSSNEDNRKIRKREFVSRIDNKKMLFDNWYLQFRGLNEFCNRIKSEYFTKINIAPSDRYFLIECDGLIDDVDVVRLISKISKNWSKLSKNTPKPFCPYVLLHGIDFDRLIAIKKRLSMQGIVLCDGYDYLGAEFNPESLIKTPDYRNEIHVKIVNELSQIEEALEVQKRKKEIYQFYLSEPFFETNKSALYNIQIPTTESILKMI